MDSAIEVCGSDDGGRPPKAERHTGLSTHTPARSLRWQPPRRDCSSLGRSIAPSVIFVGMIFFSTPTMVRTQSSRHQWRAGRRCLQHQLAPTITADWCPEERSRHLRVVGDDRGIPDTPMIDPPTSEPDTPGASGLLYSTLGTASPLVGRPPATGKPRAA